MSGKIIVVCGACQKKLGVPETASGKRIRCPGCSEPISVPVNSAAPPSDASRRPRTAASNQRASAEVRDRSSGQELLKSPRKSAAGKSPQGLKSAGAPARKKRSAPTSRKAGTERRYADPIDDDLFGGDAYGDDLYGDETSGRQLPSVKRKKKSSSSSSSGSAKSSGGFLSSYEGQRIRAMGTGFLMMAGAAVWFI